MIDLPNLKERDEHFQLYLGKLKLEKPEMINVVAQRLAALTPGIKSMCF